MAHANASTPLATPPSPGAARVRRDSLASVSTSSQVDKAQLAITLDKIHTSASQTGVLTTFNDFAPPPGSLPVVESKGTAGELVQQGLSGLYSRFKEAVGAVGKVTVQEVDDGDGPDSASKKTSTSPLPRGESGATNSTFDSTTSSELPTSGTMTSSGAMTADSSYPPQSSKASSITTASTPKTAPSSVQNLTKMVRGVATTTPSAGVAPVMAKGMIDKEASRGVATRLEEQSSRSTGRRSMSRPAEGTPTSNHSGNPSLESLPISDRISMPSRSRRDDALSIDGSTETPSSPVTNTVEMRVSSTSSRAAPGDAMRKPAVIDRIAYSGGGTRSRSSSMEPGTAEPSPVSTSAHSSVYHDSFAHNERPQRLQSGAMKIPGTTTNEGAPEMVNARLEMMRKQVLSKEFWMADETCKECFLCGTPFSAFRRKHHCRTCGCIFDSKCTSSISGQKFGVQGSLRVCKTCLNVINRRYDSGSDDSGDEYFPAIFRPNQPKPQPVATKPRTDDEMSISERTELAEDPRTATTPMMAIPATRRVGEGNRNSALSRPSSSRNDIQPSSLDPDRSSFGPYLNAGKKHRFRHGEKSVSGLSFTSRGHDESSGLPNLSVHNRPPRRRNLSTASASVHHLRSPRPKSGIFKGPSISADALSAFEQTGVIDAAVMGTNDNTHDTRSHEAGLNPASMQHVKKLFRQLLADANVPNAGAWERALIPILDQCADDVDPNIRNGDDMDIRHWVKLKKIPGGKPSDTAYVHGVVFTKNLALKSMPRKIHNPKIVIITFPIEYQRHSEQHFMSLQPVIEQEKEYLRMVVNRILNLEPQVLLVEKTVAGVALQYLADANVAVAYNVKPSVIDAISRIANMPIISSMDMLSLGVRVGSSESFEVKTYVNNEIKGKKKTYLYVAGCPKDRGCTIVLRGAPTQILARMKKITEFMVYVVYNLKLESCLMRDEFVHIPEAVAISPPASSRQQTDDSLALLTSSTPEQNSQNPAVLVTGPSSEGQNVSQSATGVTADGEQPPPTPVDQVRPVLDQTKRLVSLHESHTHVSQDTQVPEDVPMPTFYSDMVAKYETRLLSASPFVKFTQPYLLMRAREQERRLVYLKRLRDQDIVEELGEKEGLTEQQFRLIKPEMVHEIGQKAPRQIMEVLHAVHDVEYDKALHNYQTQTRQWETYIQGSLDLFDPYSHQNIVVLYSVTCNATKIPCAEPGLIAIEFYNEHADASGNLDPDFTLGQYIEDICESADSICHSNGCDKKMAEHHRTYVHDNARITVMVEDAPVWPKNFPEKPQERDGEKDGTGICMWNFCKVCNKHFGLMPMSVSTWKYSFGKYLELSFWNRGLRVHPQTECPHDHQKDHVRYFYYLYRNIAIRVHYDPIDLYEIIVPRPRITWKVDNDLKLKNEIFTRAEERWNKFIHSVNARLKSIRIDSVLPEKAGDCKAEVESLTKKAQEDQRELIRTLQSAYMSSKYYEIIPLNVVVREMLEKSSEWDAAFAKFEADFLSDKDVRQLTIIQLKKIFTDNESKESLPTTDGTASVGSESEEKTTPATTQTSMSEVDEKPAQPNDQETSQPPQTPLSPTSGPPPLTQDAAAMQADEILDRVNPLDLATPASPSGLTRDMLIPPHSVSEVPKTPSEQPANTTPVPSGAVVPRQADALAAVTETPLYLTEKVEQLRREQRAASTDASSSSATPDNASESTRPGDRAVSRRAGLTVSPPITRALSQPVGTLPRTQSAIGKLLKEQKAQDSQGAGKEEKKFTDRIGIGALKNRKPGPSGIPRYVHGKRESKVSTLARHFEQLSREFEKERMRDRKQRAAKMQTTRAFLPRTSTKAIVEVYEDVDQAVQELGPSDDDHLDKKSLETSTVAETTPEDSQTKPSDSGLESPNEMPSQPTGEATTAGTEANENHHENPAGSDDEGGGSDADHSTITLDDLMPDVKEIAESLDRNEDIPEELPRHQKKSLMTMLTNFWAERSSSGWTPLEYPIHASDHIFIDSDVVVREDEPSSLVAFALSSEDYKVKLADIRRQWKMSNQPDTDESSDGLEMKGQKGVDARGLTLDEADLEKSLLRSTGTHLKYQFTEGSARMTCKIFYAEQFDALRRKCGVADRIIESLSRCLKWDSKGGKTKSVFLKTLDDRLVMKSLSPIETSAFLKFAPHYFNIMAEALFHDLPSVIAKMLGFFQVIIKNPLTNTEIKLDLLVMENLFYDRTPTRTFDLKGSMRNRRIQSTGEGGEVLLDENMVEYIYESPLFAREHSKRLLRASDVMDYSLMIAVDEVKKELVVGIIDCIRTYTWDKQLESWIKNRGFAGGGKNRPTVTSPKEYKSRFREAMARYGLLSLIHRDAPWSESYDS
ncbi:hypothetical protein B0T14DRAFT_532379 [Immersiella caudata]|uniref:1-phosphatidylinositol-3-phosphate 5-kinase n=1 Tax=Immersiella caudata TaxID=314043 RepID=A0AA39XDL9_9PEZI|nr:hypothetical protein B0T14DRAFT_532379 [Immersiella caudata]